MSNRRSEQTPYSPLTLEQAFAKINTHMPSGEVSQPQPQSKEAPTVNAPKATMSVLNENIAAIRAAGESQLDPRNWLLRFRDDRNGKDGKRTQIKKLAEKNEEAKALQERLLQHSKIGGPEDTMEQIALETRTARFADAQKRIDVQLNAVSLESLSAPMQELVRIAVDAYALQAEQQVQALKNRSEKPLSEADALAEVKKNNHVVVNGKNVIYVGGENVTYSTDGKLQFTPGEEDQIDDVTGEIAYQMQADGKTPSLDKDGNKITKKRPGKSTSTVQIITYKDEVPAADKKARKPAEVVTLTNGGREISSLDETHKLSDVVRNAANRPAKIAYTPARPPVREVNEIAINSPVGIDKARYFDTLAYVARHPDLGSPVTIVSGQTEMVSPAKEGVISLAGVTEKWQIGEFKESVNPEVVAGRVAVTTEQAALLRGMSPEEQQAFLISQKMVSADNNFSEHPIEIRTYDIHNGQSPDASANVLKDAATAALERKLKVQADRVVVINQGLIPTGTLNRAEMAMVIGAGLNSNLTEATQTVEAANAFNLSVAALVESRKIIAGNENKSNRDLALQIMNETLSTNYPDTHAEGFERRKKAAIDLVRQLYPLTDGENFTEALKGINLTDAITLGAKVGLNAEGVTTLFNAEHPVADMSVTQIQSIASQIISGEDVAPDVLDNARRALELTATSEGLTVAQKAALERTLGPRQLTADEIFDKVATARRTNILGQNEDALRAEIAHALERELTDADRTTLTQAQELLPPRVKDVQSPEALYGGRVKQIMESTSREDALLLLGDPNISLDERQSLRDVINLKHPEVQNSDVYTAVLGSGSRESALLYLHKQGFNPQSAQQYLVENNIWTVQPVTPPATPTA